MNHHVDAVGVTVGEVGSLSGLKVQTVPTAARRCMREHLFDRDIKRCIRSVIARDALEPQSGLAGILLLDLCLHVDVRQHAVRHHVLQPKGSQQLVQHALDGGD